MAAFLAPLAFSPGLNYRYYLPEAGCCLLGGCGAGVGFELLRRRLGAHLAGWANAGPPDDAIQPG